MTREERKLALYCLKANSDYHSEVCEECVNYPNCDHTIQDDVTEIIIKALEQEPCQDAISRQAAIDAVQKNTFRLTFSEEQNCEGHVAWSANTVYSDVIEGALLELPPVSTEKTGRWIMPVQDDGMSDPIYYQVRCSECGFDLDPQTWHQELHQYGADKYCPKCGCRMMEVEE